MTRVLLMNDNPAMRLSLRRLLEETPGVVVVGEAALTRGGGVDAGPSEQRPAVEADGQPLDSLAEVAGSVDAVVVDVGLDVSAAAARIQRLRAELAPVRVIAMTVMPEPETAARLCEAGAEAVLDKAGPVASLIEAIRGG